MVEGRGLVSEERRSGGEQDEVERGGTRIRRCQRGEVRLVMSVRKRPLWSDVRLIGALQSSRSSRVGRVRQVRMRFISEM